MSENRLEVLEQSKSGMNKKFLDSVTRKLLNRTQVVEGIDNGTYPNYEHYRMNGKLIIRRKRDGKNSTNLG